MEAGIQRPRAARGQGRRMTPLDAPLAEAGLNPRRLETLLDAGDVAIPGLAVPGPEAVAIWERLRESLPALGYWPILVGGAAEMVELEESAEDAEGDAAELRQRAGAVDVAAFFAERQRDLLAERA